MSSIKDKRIILKGLAYIAEVHWYCGRVTSAGHHATLKAAQAALAKYPNDVFEGYDNPSSDKAMTLMNEIRRQTESPYRGRPRRKNLPSYERLYDRRVM